MKMPFKGFIDLIGFSVQRSKYFFELVLFNKAKGEIEIRERYERLLSLRDSSARVLQNKEFTYFSKWYYPAVRLCMLNAPFTGDYQELAQRLSPPIEEQEAREAVSTLETLGLIKNTPAGWEVLDSHLSTGDAWSNLAIREFQRTMLQRAGESLYTHSKENREIATLSLAIPRAEIATLQDMMQEFRKKVAQWALSLEDSDCVMQFNLSCFPLSLPPLNEQESQRAVSGELES
jgi:uncharacterized protein (TIGR02147 family)